MRGLPENRVFRRVDFLAGLLSKSRPPIYVLNFCKVFCITFEFLFSNFLSHDIKNQRGMDGFFMAILERRKFGPRRDRKQQLATANGQGGEEESHPPLVFEDF